MGTPAARSRYSLVAMLLHWAIAIGVIANWRIAEAAENLPQAERGAVMSWHFAIGMAILLATLARIIWRLVHRPPPLSSRLAVWERVLARVTHSIFYILLLALPLLGWIGMSGYKAPIDMFGFVWPVLPVGFGEKTGHEILEFHATLGSLMILLVGLHLLGVIKHMVVDRDGNLWRMLPFGTPKA
ncbi:cytochrome b [Croceicoccus estronivorus]|uniref:cytochrome b n=1 Tax=Croceicoccus estronivorus TaxID=1172626 RepID=UPI001F352FEB|nr:cytochrome b/b6 domain-containing protein [Croceicoccus estronivorus]